MNNANSTQDKLITGSLFDKIMQANMIIVACIFILLIIVFLVLFTIQLYDETVYGLVKCTAYLQSLFN